jgi:hypothetical protein
MQQKNCEKQCPEEWDVHILSGIPLRISSPLKSARTPENKNFSSSFVAIHFGRAQTHAQQYI